MYYVYILENEAGNHYIGYTSDLLKRIKGHNSSKSRWTRKKGTWRLAYKEEYPTKKEAFLRERQIKRYRGGRAFKELLTKSRLQISNENGEMSEPRLRRDKLV